MMVQGDDWIKPIPAKAPSAGQLLQIERKFGMFLHFGVNTFGNVEWSDGTIPAESYHPEQIDADQYEQCGLNDVDAAVADCRRAFDEKNIVVINMPPNTKGRLVDGDIVHLMEIAERLGVRRR